MKSLKPWGSRNMGDKMRHDLLSDVLSTMKNGDRFGKRETIVPASNLVKDVLLLIQKHGFIGNFEYIDDGRGGKFKIELIGKINGSGSIRPRFAVKKDEYERWERRFLPAAGIGFLIISTPKGVLTHVDAKKSGIGGKLLCYIY